MALVSHDRQSISLGAASARSVRNPSTMRPTRLSMSAARATLSMATTVPNAQWTRKNYRLHDQVTAGLESNVTIV